MNTPAAQALAGVVTGVRQHDDGQVALALAIPFDLPCLPGHFPRYPLLPGVVQVAWAVEGARRHLQAEAPVRDIERLKFMHPIQPPAQLTLLLERLSTHTIRFRYHDAHRDFAIGQLRYAD